MESLETRKAKDKEGKVTECLFLLLKIYTTIHFFLYVEIKHMYQKIYKSDTLIKQVS